MNRSSCVLLAIATTLCSIGPLSASPETDEQETLRALEFEIVEARRQLERATTQLQAMKRDRNVTAHAIPQIHREVIRREPRPMLGVVLLANENDNGVRLGGVTPNGPASKAGLNANDLLLEINGIDLQGRGALETAYDALEDMQAGDEFVVLYQDSNGDQHRVVIAAENHAPSVILNFSGNFDIPLPELKDLDFDIGQFDMEIKGLRDSLHAMRGMRFAGSAGLDVLSFASNWSGLELSEINPGLSRYFGVDQGALVLDVEGLDSSSELMAGDVIVGVNGSPATSPRDVMRKLREVGEGELVQFDIVRDTQKSTIEVTAPERSGFSYFYEFGGDE